MFDGIVDRYDALNRLISLGLDRFWRQATVRAIQAKPRDRVLDLGCGTGDLSRLVSGQARVAGVDVSWQMLLRARGRLDPSVGLVRGSAFELPFADGSFQGAVSGFVLRNLHDLEAAMAELARVMAPGGRIALLDATEPRGFLRPAFDAYFRLAAPVFGALAGKRQAYEYLAASLAQIPPPADMCRILAHAGFDGCAAQPLTFGVVTLFTGLRSRRPARSGRGMQ
ncbi:MAG TPA: ubiquinone/menaquinone biosynthesis methyltransferase [Chloroflexota bacterium]|nr:ubiquinone/menaquinone biosynthesis methyltransferase [Chloroflexota bacterium]